MDMNDIKYLDRNEIKIIEFIEGEEKCIFKNAILKSILYETLDSKIIDVIKSIKSKITSQIKE